MMEEFIEDNLPQFSVVIETFEIEKVAGKDNEINRENEDIKSKIFELEKAVTENRLPPNRRKKFKIFHNSSKIRTMQK